MHLIMRRRLIVISAALSGLVLFVILTKNGSRTTSQLRRQVGHPDAKVQQKARPVRAREIVVGDHAMDLSDLMERTHFGFEQRVDDAFLGGDASYAVSVRNGGVAVHPEIADGPRKGEGGAPATLRTVSVQRAGFASDSAAPAYERAEDGHLIAELDDAVSEHLRNTRSGLEQSWHIDAKPEGSGDLVVRIAVSGERYLARTQTGLHFQDPDSGLGVSYSDARWIDANGNETEVVANFENGQIVMAVPADVVERSAYPAVLDPTVGPELALDSPISMPAPDVQSAPAIAHSGNDQMLVIWQDRRRTVNLAFDLYAAHVSTNGTISEQVGFLVTDPSDNRNHTTPAAVWDGGNFVIVFVSKDAQGGDSHIRARIIQGALSTTPMSNDSNNFDGNRAIPDSAPAPAAAILTSRGMPTAITVATSLHGRTTSTAHTSCGARRSR